MYRYFDQFNNEEKTKNAYKQFNKIVCVSQYAKEKFTERMGIKENVIVRYNINLTNDIKIKQKKKLKKNLIKIRLKFVLQVDQQKPRDMTDY